MWFLIQIKIRQMRNHEHEWNINIQSKKKKKNNPKQIQNEPNWIILLIKYTKKNQETCLLLLHKCIIMIDIMFD